MWQIGQLVLPKSWKPVGKIISIFAKIIKAIPKNTKKGISYVSIASLETMKNLQYTFNKRMFKSSYRIDSYWTPRFISRKRFSSNLGTFSSNLYIFAIVEWPKCDKTHQSTLVAMYSRMGFNMRYGASLGLQILDLQFEDSYWRFYYKCTHLA